MEIYLDVYIMDSFISGGGLVTEKKTFLNHIFSTTEEGKAEILNVLQYSILAIIPIVLLNKSIQYFIPDLDFDKPSFQILAEIIFQIFFLFISIILIHRFISFFPTFSGFKYDSFSLYNFILPFFIIIFSIQSKLGNKINLLFDRSFFLFFGESNDDTKSKVRSYKYSGTSGGANNHSPSQADYLDNSTMQTSIFPPAPVASKPSDSYTASQSDNGSYFGPMAANSVLGGSFGSSF